MATSPGRMWFLLRGTAEEGHSDLCGDDIRTQDWKWHINKAGVRTKRTKTGGVLEGVGAMDINRLSITKDKLLLLKIFKVPLSLNMLHAQEFTAPEGGSKLFSR